MHTKRPIKFSSALALTLALVAVASLVATIHAANGSAQKQGTLGPAFSADRIAAHVKFLATDLLEGRGTGQRGGDIAAEYIATQFALYGLKPAGDNGTYMQKVPMVGITPQPATTFALVPAKGGANDLKPLDQYVA